MNPDLEPTVKRARYSALTMEEIEGAFSNLDTLSYPLAHAAGARQDIDLIWGAAFTRAVSLMAKAYGANFLSVGRVQRLARASMLPGSVTPVSAAFIRMWRIAPSASASIASNTTCSTR